MRYAVYIAKQKVIVWKKNNPSNIPIVNRVLRKPKSHVDQ